MFNPEEKNDNIDRVKDSLYSKNTDGIFDKRRHVLQDKTDLKVPTSWESAEEEKVESSFNIPYTKILLGAFVFFVLALGFAFSRFFLGSNVVSGNNIDILVSGPASIAGGEELPLDIEIKNNNNTDLNTVSLRVEYPEGTKNPTNSSVDMKRHTESIGSIKVGRSEKRLIKSILYGEENSRKVVKIYVEYRVAGSNAIFTKEKDFNVLISSSPVNIKVNAPSEINANQLTDFTIDVSSNSATLVKGLMLKVEYPFGFNLVSSNPKPLGANDGVFVLGDLAPGAKRTIKISGSVAGQDGEQRTFKFAVGTPSSDDNTVVGTTLALYLADISLKKSSIGVNMTINEDSNKEVSIRSGSNNSVSIFWKNNLAEKLYDVVVKVNISGLILDKQTVRVDRGFYNSANNTIIFDKNSDPDLFTVNPGLEGDLHFDFNTLVPSSKSPISFGNSSIRFDISVSGNRTGVDSGADSEILFSDTKTAKLSSSLRLLSRAFRTIGPFENSGPFPPKVDNETTYTITWTATNSFNNVNSAKVSATLPPNVKWTGFTSPESERISYNKGTGEVVWDIGDMKAGIGTNSPAKDVSFQVAITPSITQVDSEVDLLSSATISGIDNYSLERIGEVKSLLTTNITSDPAYTDDVGKVTR